MTIADKLRRNWVNLTILAVCLYLFAAFARLRFANPDMTETQLFLNFWRAVTWQ